ncbi:MAG: 50S ribosomal protein L9 [Chloroflexi bacterium]|nr:50S ribosomal protein L9 [Chloroflexota bacterium]
MKVVFVEEVEGTAHVGEIKDVKNGFARNFLLPRNLAVPATKHNLQRAEKLTKVDAVRQDKLDSAAQGVADKLQGAHVTLTARVGQQGRLFGSVTATDIASKLNEETGSDIEHRQVLLSQVIRTLGTQELRVRLTRNVFADVTVTVESEDGTGELTIAEAVEAVEAEEASDAEGAAEAAVESEAEEASDDADGSETASE